MAHPLRLCAGLLAMVILRGTMNFDGGTHFNLKNRPDEDKPSKVDIGEIKTLMTDGLYQSHHKFYAVRLSGIRV